MLALALVLVVVKCDADGNESDDDSDDNHRHSKQTHVLTPPAVQRCIAWSSINHGNLLDGVNGTGRWEGVALRGFVFGPGRSHAPVSEVAEPITIEQFLQAACHRCDHVKSTTILFDVHFEVSEFGGVARGSYRKVNLIICLFSFVSVANFLQT